MSSSASPSGDGEKPLILSASSEEDRARIENLRRAPDIVSTTDNYLRLVDELAELGSPAISHATAEVREEYFRVFRNEHLNGCSPEGAGVWVLYPWTRHLVHFLAEDDWDKLRTSRNRNVIYQSEQKVLRDTPVAVCGLSVGHSVATSLSWIGASKCMKLADPDHLSGANLNRIRSGIESIGLAKTTIISRQIYELDPFAQLHLYPQGVTEDSIASILDDAPAPQIVVDEMDSFRAKVLLRAEARRRKLPVVMAFDIPQGTLVDVERFDIDQGLPLFHGLLGDISIDDLPPTMPIQEMAKYVMQLYPPKYLTARMMESISLFGKEIVSAPQLAISAFFAGAAVSRAVMAIALGEPIGRRSYLSWDQAYAPEHDELAQGLRP